MYLTLLDYTKLLRENIQTHVLSPTAVLYNEPEFLLHTELRNPARYMSILEAIAIPRRDNAQGYLSGSRLGSSSSR